MRIFFVRHGNPNYELDCLTELGHEQAVAAAARLEGEGIQRIYSSSCGRAQETAEHTARALGLEVTPCDFIREIDWSPLDRSLPSVEGNPWLYCERLVREGKTLCDPDWRQEEFFASTETPTSFDKVAKGIDAWLATLGFEREGAYYRKREEKCATVAMFCHGGAFACAFAHMFNLPLPFVFTAIPFGQTGVIEVELGGVTGGLCTPRLGVGFQMKHLTQNGITVTGF